MNHDVANGGGAIGPLRATVSDHLVTLTKHRAARLEVPTSAGESRRARMRRVIGPARRHDQVCML